jgi:hypothetical protein
MRDAEFRVGIDQLAANLNGFVILARPDANAAGYPSDNRRLRMKLARTIDFSNRFLFSAANLANVVGVPLSRRGVVRIEIE